MEFFFNTSSLNKFVGFGVYFPYLASFLYGYVAGHLCRVRMGDVLISAEAFGALDGMNMNGV